MQSVFAEHFKYCFNEKQVLQLLAIPSSSMKLGKNKHFFNICERKLTCDMSKMKFIYFPLNTMKLGYNEIGCLRTLGYNEQIFRANWLR